MHRSKNTHESPGNRRPRRGMLGLASLVLSLNLVLAACGLSWNEIPSWSWDRTTPSEPDPTATPRAEVYRTEPPIVPTPYATGWATPTPMPPGSDNLHGTPVPSTPVPYTPTPVATATAPPTPSPTPSPTPVAGITVEDLERVLIRASDLPGDWTPTSAIEIDLTSQNSICNLPGPDTVFAPKARAQSQFQQTDFGPFLGMNVSAYATRGAAREVMDYLRQATSCDSWNDPALDLDWKVSGIDYPDKGDESFAVRLTTSFGFIGSINVHAVFVRTDSVITLVAYGAIGSLNVSDSEPMVDLALDKLEALP